MGGQLGPRIQAEPRGHREQGWVGNSGLGFRSTSNLEGTGDRAANSKRNYQQVRGICGWWVGISNLGLEQNLESTGSGNTNRTAKQAEAQGNRRSREIYGWRVGISGRGRTDFGTEDRAAKSKLHRRPRRIYFDLKLIVRLCELQKQNSFPLLPFSPPLQALAHISPRSRPQAAFDSSDIQRTFKVYCLGTIHAKKLRS